MTSMKKIYDCFINYFLWPLKSKIDIDSITTGSRCLQRSAVLATGVLIDIHILVLLIFYKVQEVPAYQRYGGIADKTIAQCAFWNAVCKGHFAQLNIGLAHQVAFIGVIVTADIILQESFGGIIGKLHVFIIGHFAGHGIELRVHTIRDHFAFAEPGFVTEVILVTGLTHFAFY